MKLPACIRVLCKSERGAALAELALVTAFVLPPLVMGAVDFGRYYYAGLALTNIAHAGAAYGAENPTSGSIATAAQQVTPPISHVTFQTPVSTMSCECSDGTGTASVNCVAVPVCASPAIDVYKIQVTATATYSTIAPWPGIPGSFNLSRTAIMRGCDGTGNC